MADVEFVRGDSGPSLNGTLTDQAGTPVDLTGASVKFQMRLIQDRRFSVNSPAAIVVPTAGTVRYDWVVGQLDVAGDYEAQWQITFSGGVIQTSDPANTITVRTE